MICRWETVPLLYNWFKINQSTIQSINQIPNPHGNVSWADIKNRGLVFKFFKFFLIKSKGIHNALNVFMLYTIPFLFYPWACKAFAFSRIRQMWSSCFDMRISWDEFTFWGSLLYCIIIQRQCCKLRVEMVWVEKRKCSSIGHAQ